MFLCLSTGTGCLLSVAPCTLHVTSLANYLFNCVIDYLDIKYFSPILEYYVSPSLDRRALSQRHSAHRQLRYYT